MVGYEGFQYCCGATEIGELNGTAREVKTQIRTILQQFEDVDPEWDEARPGMLIATTVKAQRGAINALRGLKFREVTTFVNPGTGNKVTLWIKKLTYKAPTSS